MTSQLNGLGKVAMWGMSPATDLLDLIAKEKLESGPNGEKKEINILMVGQSDIRHSLQTLTKHWNSLKENKICLNIYIVETSLELFARQMLFWTIALESPQKLGLYEKTVQFMEIFGNILVRPQTKKTVMAFADRLINVVTEDPNAPIDLESFFDFSELKFRERDGITEIFKFWKNFSNSASFDMEKHWNCRLRNYLKTRYDARLGVFDWDYHMKLVEKGITIIGPREYKNWRNSGIAFPDFDSEYSQPNLTLASLASQTRGLDGIRSSFWGDIITGPFICHGIECDDKSLFEKSSGTHKKKSYDLTFTNLQNIFKFTSNIVEQNGKSRICENVKIHFVSFSNFMILPLKSKYEEFFDVAYFGNSMVHLMLPVFKNILAPEAIVLAENARYAFEFRPEQDELFTTKLLELAKNMNLEVVDPIQNAPELEERKNSSENETSSNEAAKIQPSILTFIKKIQTETPPAPENCAETENATMELETCDCEHKSTKQSEPEMPMLTNLSLESGDADSVGHRAALEAEVDNNPK